MIDATGLLTGSKVLEERDSNYNGHLVVKRDLAWGTYIQADGLTQSGGVVGSIWKNVFRKLPNSSFIVHNSLVLGLGGGTIAKLVLKKYPDAKITGIEIDPLMVALGEKYLGLDSNKVGIVVEDALDYCEQFIGLPVKSVHQFDLIFVDLYCGDKFPDKFENERFLKLIKRRLGKGGIAVFNRLYYGDKRKEAIKFGNKLEGIFTNVKWVYPEANLMFICSDIKKQS